jgi:DNA-binding XRE family transcriptional regulator
MTGKEFRLLREKLGLSQEATAVALGVCRRTIIRAEQKQPSRLLMLAMRSLEIVRKGDHI